jgi:hypothetical protein
MSKFMIIFMVFIPFQVISLKMMSGDDSTSPRGTMRGLICLEGFLSLYPDDSWCAGYHGIYGQRKDAT